MFTRRYSVTLWVCVRSGVHVLASLDFKSGSLVVREGSSSVWLLPVSPTVVFQQLSGVNMCSITAHPLSFCYKQPKRPEWFTELILFLELHCSGLCGLTWDGCCSHPYPSPCLSSYISEPPISLCLLLYSCPLLFIGSCSPFPVHCIMFMWCAFHFFISVIRYRIPPPTHSTWPSDDCTNAFLEDCISLCFTAILPPLFFFKNQLPIKKVINSKALCCSVFIQLCKII